MVTALIVMSLFLGGREIYHIANPEPKQLTYCPRYEETLRPDGSKILVCVEE